LLTVRLARHTLVSRFEGEDAELVIEATGGWVYYISQEMGSAGECLAASSCEWIAIRHGKLSRRGG